MDNLVTELKKKKEGMKKTKFGKDTYIILILAGILLFIIALPTKKDSPSGEVTSSENGKASALFSDQQNQGNTDGVKTGTLQSEMTGEKDKAAGSTEAYADYLEKKLEAILSSVEGVGAVQVMITVKSSEEQIIEKDIPNSRSIITEEDAEGGNRNSNDMTSEEKTVYITDAEGNQIPYVVKKLEPDIEGVMIVAQGGGNAIVNKNITEVIQALFGIEAHKIVVVRMKTK